MKGTFDPLVESIEIIEEDMESLITWQNDTESVISDLQAFTSSKLLQLHSRYSGCPNFGPQNVSVFGHPLYFEFNARSQNSI